MEFISDRENFFNESGENIMKLNRYFFSIIGKQNNYLSALENEIKPTKVHKITIIFLTLALISTAISTSAAKQISNKDTESRTSVDTTNYSYTHRNPSKPYIKKIVPNKTWYGSGDKVKIEVTGDEFLNMEIDFSAMDSTYKSGAEHFEVLEKGHYLVSYRLSKKNRRVTSDFSLPLKIRTKMVTLRKKKSRFAIFLKGEDQFKYPKEILLLRFKERKISTNV